MYTLLPAIGDSKIIQQYRVVHTYLFMFVGSPGAKVDHGGGDKQGHPPKTVQGGLYCVFRTILDIPKGKLVLLKLHMSNGKQTRSSVI